jgi:hypothetical protein
MAQSEAIEAALGKLEDLRSRQVQNAKAMYDAYHGVWYAMDLFASAAINRSVALLSGFQTMIRGRNMICAGALLRLQIDNAIRFYSAFIVPDPHRHVLDILDGRRIDKMTDECGKLMKDAYLIEKLSEEYPWLKRVYKETSGYIHLSHKHMMSAITGHNDTSRSIEVKISDLDKELPDWIYLEAIEAFLQTTRLFLKYLEGWIFTKANPEIVAEMKRKRDAATASHDDGTTHNGQHP